MATLQARGQTGTGVSVSVASDTGHEARRASGIGPTAGQGCGHAQIPSRPLGEGVDQVRHPLLVGHRPVEMLRLEQAVQGAGSTKLLDKIKRAGKQEAECRQAVAGFEDSLVACQKDMHPRHEGVPDQRSVVANRHARKRLVDLVGMDAWRRDRNSVCVLILDKGKRGAELFPGMESPLPPRLGEWLPSGIVDDAREDREPDVSEHPKADEHLETFEFFALLRRHGLRERFTIPALRAVLEVVDKQVHVPRDLQRSPPDTAQKQRGAVVVAEVWPFGRADLARKLQAVCSYPTDRVVSESDAPSLHGAGPAGAVI